MKLSRYTSHIALQTQEEIILLDYSIDGKVETVNLKKTDFKQYHFLKFTREVLILAENNKLFTY
jgi:hypothetical protein